MKVTIEVEKEEMMRWRKEAKAAGVSVSEWIRGRCGIVGVPETPKSSRSVRTCRHGIPDDMYCSYCFGMAKIEIRHLTIRLLGLERSLENRSNGNTTD